MLLEHAEMDEDVALGLVADDEAEAAGRVEPFDRAGELDAARFVDGSGAGGLAPGDRGTVPPTRASRRDVIYA